MTFHLFAADLVHSTAKIFAAIPWVSVWWFYFPYYNILRTTPYPLNWNLAAILICCLLEVPVKTYRHAWGSLHSLDP